MRRGLSGNGYRMHHTLHGEVVGLLQRLIACDTSNPPGHEAAAAAIIEEHVSGTGLVCERVAKEPDRPNLLVRLPGSGRGPSLAFLGHLDVVTARRDDWSVDPFLAAQRDGAIWGRGAVDMKCQVAATTVALAALAREGFRPAGDLMLILMADEELGEAGVGAPFLVEERPDLSPDFVVGEGAGERYRTDNGPIYLLDCGVKASAGATLTVHGRAQDASLAYAEESAVTEMRRLLARLDEHRSPTKLHPLVRSVLNSITGPGSDEERLEQARAMDPGLQRVLDALVGTVIHPTAIEVPGPPNVIADRATVELNCIVLPGTTAEDLEGELRAALGEGRYDLEVTPPQGGLTSSPDTPLRTAIEAFLADRDPEATLLPALGYGFSDCDRLREAYGSVAYGFIPFRHGDPMVNLTTKHGNDERILVDDLVFQLDAALSVARAIGSQAEVDQAA